VLTGFWGSETSAVAKGTHHIDTARWADAILIAPASAHFIGKMANGLADDLLSTEILAFQGPVLVAPAMNPAMFAHPAVQENIRKLNSYGIRWVGPTQGMTACGEEGLGRMIEPDSIVEELATVFFQPPKKQKVVITLGPTHSMLDPVRYLTNRSSGLMGAALCWAALEQGYEVTAICGPSDAPLPEKCQIIRVETAEEMANAALHHWESTHIFIGAAAVLDWDVANPSNHKLKKEAGIPYLQFKQNPDILAAIGDDKRPNQFVLGFAAETEDPITYGKRKLISKKCDAIFANDVSIQGQGFESERNGGWWITKPDQVLQIETGPKALIARQIFSLISKSRREG
jgi:phosphopantothenoylcysteine decarboxylase/phosphopantothenate--cysteine ligase